MLAKNGLELIRKIEKRFRRRGTERGEKIGKLLRSSFICAWASVSIGTFFFYSASGRCRHSLSLFLLQTNPALFFFFNLFSPQRFVFFFLLFLIILQSQGRQETGKEDRGKVNKTRSRGIFHTWLAILPAEVVRFCLFYTFGLPFCSARQTDPAGFVFRLTSAYASPSRRKPLEQPQSHPVGWWEARQR